MPWVGCRLGVQVTITPDAAGCSVLFFVDGARCGPGFTGASVAAAGPLVLGVQLSTAAEPGEGGGVRLLSGAGGGNLAGPEAAAAEYAAWSAGQAAALACSTSEGAAALVQRARRLRRLQHELE